VTLRRVAGAVVVVFAYVALATVSGRLSPIARRPVLDGLGPVAPYQWVDPPPELIATNVLPATGDFKVPLSPQGSEPGVFLTPDAQVTLTVERGAFPARRGDRAVRLSVTPLDPATLGRLPGGLTAFGNAVEVRATYQPSGRPATRVARPIGVVLIYPVTQDLHATAHAIQHSADGRTWEEVESQDALALQQVAASFRSPGYLVVGGVLSPRATEGRDPFVTVLLVGSAVTLLAGAALLVRARSAK
jgi:hypothetical protein